MTVRALLMGGRLVLGLLHGAGSSSKNGSDHLWHTQVCDCQLEVALVEYLCVCFLAARGSDPVQLVFVPLNRFGVVKGRGGHATTGRSVDEQAGTAESFQFLERRQDSHLVEIDASIDLIRIDLDPGDLGTGALTRAVLAMHGSDLPFLDLPATTEKLHGPVTNRSNGLLACVHRLLGLPGAGNNAAAGRSFAQ